MKTILIVDDERIIADGLMQVISRHFEDKLDAVNAYSAKQALEIFRTRRVDILLTDIQMPNKSGVELMKEVKESWPWCQVVFLTGYMVFDHVYTATQYSQVKYLLKSEGYDKILDTIQECLDDLDHQTLAAEVFERAERLDKERLVLRRDRFLTEFLAGDRVYNADEHAHLEQLGFRLDFTQAISILLLRIDPPKYKLTKELAEQQIALLCSLLEEHLASLMEMVIHVDRYDNILLIYQAAAEDRLLIQEHLGVIQERYSQHFGLTLSMIMAIKSMPFKDLPCSYLDMHYRLNYVDAQIAERTILLTDDACTEIEHKQSNQLTIQTSALLHQLEQCIGLGDGESFNSTLGVLLGMYESDQSANYSMIRAFYRISLMLMDYLSLHRDSNAIILAKLAEMRRVATWLDVQIYLRSLSSEVFRHQKERSKVDSQGAVKQVIDYIAGHIGDQDRTSLAALADRVYLSPSYLSRLFHTETGVRLSDYISMQRLEAAKRLLTDPNKRVNDVACELGFDIPSNFTRFFKKHSGLTPLEWQRQMTEGL